MVKYFQKLAFFRRTQQSSGNFYLNSIQKHKKSQNDHSFKQLKLQVCGKNQKPKISTSFIHNLTISKKNSSSKHSKNLIASDTSHIEKKPFNYNSNKLYHSVLYFQSARDNEKTRVFQHNTQKKSCSYIWGQRLIYSDPSRKHWYFCQSINFLASQTSV